MTDTFPTSVIGPSYPVSINQTPKILKTDFGDSYTSETPDGLNFLLKSFDLTWDAVTTSEKGTIITFLESQGGYKSFNWTFDSVSYLVKCRKWNTQTTDPSIYKITATFDQVPL